MKRASPSLQRWRKQVRQRIHAASRRPDYRNDQTVSSYSAYLRDAFTSFWTSTSVSGSRSTIRGNWRAGPEPARSAIRQKPACLAERLSDFGKFLALSVRLNRTWTAPRPTLFQRSTTWRSRVDGSLRCAQSPGQHPYRRQFAVRRQDDRAPPSTATGSTTTGEPTSVTGRPSRRRPSTNSSFRLRQPAAETGISRTTEAAVHFESGRSMCRRPPTGATHRRPDRHGRAADARLRSPVRKRRPGPDQG